MQASINDPSIFDLESIDNCLQYVKQVTTISTIH